MKKILFLFSVIFFVSACADRLNIEPEQSLSTDLAFVDENTSRASLLGVYSRCQDLEVVGSMPQIIADYQGDNVNFIGSFPTLQDINLWTTLSDNASLESIFRDNYRAILAANAVIQNAPGVADVGFSDAEKSSVVGEALFLRALVYFNLVNLYAQPYTLDNGASPGLTLILTPDILNGEEVLAGRNTVAEVYDQIESDLTMAMQSIDDATVAGPSRATTGAAQALLARLALYKGDYPTAVTMADNVTKNASFALASDYSFYNSLSSEDVFTIEMSTTDNSRTGTGGWASYYLPAELGARGDCPISDAFLATFEPGDKRLEMTTVGANGLTYTTKYPDATNNTDNAPVIRITEMYLTLAESLARTTNTVSEDILALLNPLRVRAGLAEFQTSDFADANALIDAILDERRKELAFEGHRRMDLLRLGLPLRSVDGEPGFGASSPGDQRVVMPIPQREIDLGSSLPQNAGY